MKEKNKPVVSHPGKVIANPDNELTENDLDQVNGGTDKSYPAPDLTNNLQKAADKTFTASEALQRG